MRNKKYFFLIFSTIFLLAGGSFAFNNYHQINNKYLPASVITSSSTILAVTNKTAPAPVLAQKIPPESPTNYTDNNNGTVVDNITGLIWKKCPQGTSGNDCKGGSPTMRIWSEARVECEKLNFAGKTGWRIPTLKELQSIVDTGTFDPAINKKFFKASADPYWTLTSPAQYPSSKFTVIFTDGSVYFSDMNNVAATRCVHE